MYCKAPQKCIIQTLLLLESGHALSSIRLKTRIAEMTSRSLNGVWRLVDMESALLRNANTLAYAFLEAYVMLAFLDLVPSNSRHSEQTALLSSGDDKSIVGSCAIQELFRCISLSNGVATGKCASRKALRSCT
jgi:hypothetical protein